MSTEQPGPSPIADNAAPPRSDAVSSPRGDALSPPRGDAVSSPHGDAVSSPRAGGHQLTRRQRQVLTAVQRFSTLQGYMPSVRELGRELGGLAPATVQHHITMLRRKGYLEHDGSSHGLRLAARASVGGAAPRGAAPVSSASPGTETSAEAFSWNATLPPRVTDDVTLTGGGSGGDDGDATPWGLEMPAMQVVIPLLGTIAAGKPLEAVEESDEYVPVPASLARGSAFALRVNGDSMVDDAILDGDLVVVQACDRVRDGEAAVVLLEDGNATLKRVHVEKDGIRLQPANSSMAPIHVKEARIRGRVVGLIRQFE